MKAEAPSLGSIDCQLEVAIRPLDGEVAESGTATRRKWVIEPAGGDAARRIAEAKAAVESMVTRAARDATLFGAQVIAYESAPRIFRMRQYLDMLTRSLEQVRKYVIVAGPDTHVIIEFEKEEKGVIDIGEPER